MGLSESSVKNYFHDNGIKLRDVAKQLGVTPGNLSNILNGRQGFSRNIAVKLNELYGFSISYLILGSGELFEFSKERTERQKSYHVVVKARCQVDTKIKANSEQEAVYRATEQLKNGCGIEIEEGSVVAAIV